MRRLALLVTLLSSVSPFAAPALIAQTVIAPSTGAASLGTSVSASGSTYTIDGGTRAGSNLFHSFQTFDLASGNTATWIQTVSDPATVRVVVNRVTGGAISQISGTIRSTSLPNASFYFLNPAGVVFGAGARFDVGGTAHFSTAQELRFADGTSFTITTPTGSTFSADAPAAFGFLGGQGDISINSVRSGTLMSPLDLAASNISIDNTNLISASLTLSAVGSQQTSLLIDNPAVTPSNAGTVSISDSLLTARGNAVSNAGVKALGGHLSFSNGRLVSQSTASRDAGSAFLRADSLVMDGFLFGSTTAFATSAGLVDLAARNVSLSGASRIQADTFNDGNAGNIVVKAGTVSLSGTSGISARGGRDAKGNAGDVRLIVAGTLSLRDQAEIASRVEFDGLGNAGDVEIDAGNISIVGSTATPDNRAEITSSTRGGEGGNVILRVAGTLSMGVSSDIRSAANTGSFGNAGDVQISANRINMQSDTSRITSSTDSVGRAGVVNVAASTFDLTRGEISSSSSAQGNAGEVRVQAGKLTIGSGQISSSASSSGDAGLVNVQADDFTLRNGLISSSTAGAGNAGQVTVRSNTLAFSNGQISSSTASTGAGGIVDVSATNISIEKGQITTATTGSGNAGRVVVKAATINLSSTSAISASAKSGSIGNAGQVTVEASGLLNMSGSTIISSLTEAGAAGNAGDVEITAGELKMLGTSGTSDKHARISTATQSGRGGNIRLAVSGTLSLLANADILAGASGDATKDGGTIAIDAGRLELIKTSSTIRTSTTAQKSNAGAISIVANDLLIDGGRLLSTTTKEGNAGSITIEGKNLEMRGASAISASTLSGSSGNAGKVSLVIGKLEMRDTAEITSRTEFDTFGNAGDIAITADEISMVGLLSSPNNRTEITSSTRAGQGGNVAINVSGALTMGVSSDIRAAANPGSTGDAGTITINAGSVRLLTDTSRITSSTQSIGDAGGVNIKASTLLVDGGEISSNAVGSADPSLAGSAGKILVSSGTAEIIGGGQISTSADGAGVAGAIDITATDSLNISSGGTIASAALAGSSGGAGTIRIRGNTMAVGAAGIVNSSTAGSGAAGKIDIGVTDLT
ncbi:beta strand repeat-containing protein, partial [Novosphingobium olei]